MVQATRIELIDGLRAAPLAGIGRLTAADDRGRFDKRYVHTDVLVVGGGPAGLAAARAGAETDARVMLVEDDDELGGWLLGAVETIDGEPALDWVAAAAASLEQAAEVRVLTRTTALGLYDHGYAVLAERRAPHPDEHGRGAVEGRLWHVRARQIVLATGAHERPIVFSGNDRPSVMLAGAAVAYATRFAVGPGERAVVFTTHDGGHEAAAALVSAGIEVTEVVDARAGDVVVATEGDPGLTGVTVARLDDDRRVHGPTREVACDLLAVTGGWSPVTQLWTHTRGTVRWSEDVGAFVPDRPNGPHHAAGAANGTFGVEEGLREGAATGARAAHLAGFGDGSARVMPSPAADRAATSKASGRLLWHVPPIDGDWSQHFVDLQRDAGLDEIIRAADAGLRSVEHVKRYTTIGTAVDQGKTSGLVSAAIAAFLTDQSVATSGLTTARPPYVPASVAFLAGRDRGDLHDPTRLTSIHAQHVARGAVMEDAGQWKRPRYFPNPGESMDHAVLRECAAARTTVAVMDASTLGKIDVQGPDASEFLDRIYTNRLSNLRVGACRYGVMCRTDGMVFDDGVTSRLSDDRFHMTTTTGNAAAVLDWLEEWLQTEWPRLRVRCTSVTEQWAVVAVVGPRSRDVLGMLAPDLDVTASAFPFMTWRDAVVAGIPARVFRISFSGELAYEINVGTSQGPAIWDAVLEAGRPYGITPYGLEAMHVLRAEKGYPIVGQETDGTVTPQDLGMDWILSKAKPFLGSRSHRRSDTSRADRRQLVGLLPLDPDALIPEGAQLVDNEDDAIPIPMVGYVTSSYRSAALGRTFALALVKGGRQRIGDVVHAPQEDRTIPATITS